MSFNDCVFSLQIYFIEPATRKSCSSKSLVYFYVMDTVSHRTNYISFSAGLSGTFWSDTCLCTLIFLRNISMLRFLNNKICLKNTEHYYMSQDMGEGIV